MASFKSLNKVLLIGNLGDDPVRKDTGKSHLTTFQLATNETWIDKSQQRQQKTEWHRIVAWGKIADDCASFLCKGTLCLIEGKLRHRKWEDKQGQTRYGTDVEATRLVVLDDSAKGKNKETVSDNVIDEDELPF